MEKLTELRNIATDPYTYAESIRKKEEKKWSDISAPMLLKN